MTEPNAEPTPWLIAEVVERTRDHGAGSVVGELLARRSRMRVPEAWISRPSPAVLWARAAEIDERLAAGIELPLAGVPFAVKDNIDVAGAPTTAGCAEFAYVPRRSATAVEQLLDAGAIFAGKTNLDQFATGLVGTRSPRYGACRNPFDPERIAGGSSSGSAIVVGTGEVAFALGTDTAGSGRVPAALCGVVGLKPTPGAVSTFGVVPAMPSFDCVSAFTGSVADARTVFDAWSTPDTAPVSAPRRLGIPTPLDWHGDDDARHCFEVAVARMEGTGCTVVEVDGALVREAGALVYGSALVAERHAAFGDFALAHPDAIDPAVLEIVRGAAGHSAVELARDLAQLASLRRDATWWDAVDALVLPTVARVPTFVEAETDPFGPSAELGLLTAFVNPLGLAAVAVPAGYRADGLPFGVSLVGPGGRERGLLARAARFAGEPDLPAPPSAAHRLPLAVVGAHLRGQPLNHQLTDRGATLRETTTTAPVYRLKALATEPAKPGLVRVAQGGAEVAVEVWTLEPAAFGDFVAAIPAPLGIGKVELADGSEVPGFLCEPRALEHAPDITSYGGWRAYLDARR